MKVIKDFNNEGTLSALCILYKAATKIEEGVGYCHDPVLCEDGRMRYEKENTHLNIKVSNKSSASAKFNVLKAIKYLKDNSSLIARVGELNGDEFELVLRPLEDTGVISWCSTCKHKVDAGYDDEKLECSGCRDGMTGSYEEDHLTMATNLEKWRLQHEGV